jgi:hypothetical protein
MTSGSCPLIVYGGMRAMFKQRSTIHLLRRVKESLNMRSDVLESGSYGRVRKEIKRN